MGSKGAGMKHVGYVVKGILGLALFLGIVFAAFWLLALLGPDFARFLGYLSLTMLGMALAYAIGYSISLSYSEYKNKDDIDRYKS